jgi:hypothetical protein
LSFLKGTLQRLQLRVGERRTIASVLPRRRVVKLALKYVILKKNYSFTY